MFTNVINNISTLMGISNTIIPDIITLIIIILLIIMTFKMSHGSILLSVIVLALYTVSMGLLTTLGIDSTLNIFTLLGDTL